LKIMKRHLDTGGYSHHSRRNTKRYWKATGIANAFRQNLDYQLRVKAMYQYYELVSNAKKRLFGILDIPYDAEKAEKVKAQLSINYTSFPTLNILASIGHTCWLLYKDLMGARSFNVFGDVYENSKKLKEYDVDEEALKKVVKLISEAVSERIVYAELIKSGLKTEIEAYRIFLAFSNTLSFDTLKDIIRNVILLGDLLPEYKTTALDPFTITLLDVVTDCSLPFINELNGSEPEDMLFIGEGWIKKMTDELLEREFMPKKGVRKKQSPDSKEGKMGFSKVDMSIPRSATQESPGFDVPRPPLFEEPSFNNLLSNELSGRKSNEIASPGEGGTRELTEEEKAFANEVVGIANTIMGASGQGNFEDMRSDLLLDRLSKDIEAGPIQGSKFDGNDFSLDLEGDVGTVSGSIFDQALDLSFDIEKIRQLETESEPLVREMKKNIYPNAEHTNRFENRKTSAKVFDKNRIPLYRVSDAIYLKFTNQVKLKKNGNASVLILADGSGSMDEKKTKFLRLITVSWLRSIMSSSIQLFSGIFNNGNVGDGRYGPKLSWIIHPVKTPAVSKKDYVKAAANIPIRGSGGQEDALALAYSISEVLNYNRSRDRSLFLVLLTDTGYCSSFAGKGMSAEDEVIEVIKHYQNKLKDRFHFTMVGLSVDSGGRLGEIANRTICLNSSDLTDTYTCARKVGLYVSECLKESNRKRSQ